MGNIRVRLWPKGALKCLNQEAALNVTLGGGYTEVTKN